MNEVYVYDPHGILDPKGWTRRHLPLDGPWRPASGYMTRKGKPRWRVWNDALPAYRAALCGPSGHVRLFLTYDAAHIAAEAQNAKEGHPHG